LSSKNSKKITRDDLEEKLREIQGDVTKAVDTARPAVSALAVGVGVVIISVVFLIGIKVGRKRNTFVEIKRI
jgi:signal transduction histidine kinase